VSEFLGVQAHKDYKVESIIQIPQVRQVVYEIIFKPFSVLEKLWNFNDHEKHLCDHTNLQVSLNCRININFIVLVRGIGYLNTYVQEG
jgi:hypothetical protein